MTVEAWLKTPRDRPRAVSVLGRIEKVAFALTSAIGLTPNILAFASPIAVGVRNCCTEYCDSMNPIQLARPLRCDIGMTQRC